MWAQAQLPYAPDADKAKPAGAPPRSLETIAAAWQSHRLAPQPDRGSSDSFARRGFSDPGRPGVQQTFNWGLAAQEEGYAQWQWQAAAAKEEQARGR